MFRKLTENDRKQTLDFLGDEPSINLFIIGDIENFGFDNDFQEIWGQFDESGEIEGVLLRFNDSFIPYYKDESFDNSAFKNIILNFQGDPMISGKASIVSSYINLYKDKKAKKMYFCELNNSSKLKKESHDVKIATQEDAERIHKLLTTIEEFTRPSTTEDIKNLLKSKTGRIYYIEDDSGKMISVSQTTAENSASAMVVGVATAKEHRKQGLMSSCLSKLCMDVLQEGKTLCLFYDNPKAGSTYHKLGFKQIGDWMLII